MNNIEKVNMYALNSTNTPHLLSCHPCWVNVQLTPSSADLVNSAIIRNICLRTNRELHSYLYLNKGMYQPLWFIKRLGFILRHQWWCHLRYKDVNVYRGWQYLSITTSYKIWRWKLIDSSLVCDCLSLPLAPWYSPQVLEDH